MSSSEQTGKFETHCTRSSNMWHLYWWPFARSDSTRPPSHSRAGFSLVHHRHSTAHSRPSGHCVAIALICDRHVYVYNPAGRTAAAAVPPSVHVIFFLALISPNTRTQSSSSSSSSLSRNYRGTVARWIRRRACCTAVRLLAV